VSLSETNEGNSSCAFSSWLNSCFVSLSFCASRMSQNAFCCSTPCSQCYYYVFSTVTCHYTLLVKTLTASVYYHLFKNRETISGMFAALYCATEFFHLSDNCDKFCSLLTVSCNGTRWCQTVGALTETFPNYFNSKHNTQFARLVPHAFLICRCVNSFVHYFVTELRGEADSRSAGKEIPAFYGTQRLITVFTRAHHWP